MFFQSYAGAGIYVFRGVLTGRLQVPGSLPNNGFVISLSTTTDFYLRFICRSDSKAYNAGMLIGLDGTTITTNHIFVIGHSLRIPGELRVENSPSQDNVTAHDQGVYTCCIPLQSGEMRDINIGIYPFGFSSEYLFLNSPFK